MKRANQRILRVGSRGSPLALSQVKEIFNLLTREGRKVLYTSQIFKTAGDLDKTTSLLTSPADNFFTNVIDQALLKGEIDVGIHSAKDLPQVLPAGLKIFALTKPLDETDALVAKAKLSQLPAGSRIGTSSLLRKQEILKINPQVKIVDIRGTIEERLALLEKGQFEGVVMATCALKRLGLQKKITEILPWEGTALQGQLAVVGREEDADLEKIFRAIDVRKSYGKVWLVGAGPGDPELISIKGVHVLKAADCVFYDFLVSKQLLDYSLKAEKIDAGKRKGQATLPQAELSRQLRQKAMAGKNVVRLKGGDPLIFGRGADEIAYLRSYHIEVEVIPGITSATGLASSLAIPLTARGISSSVAFLSGHGEEEQHHSLEALDIPQAETLVFLMGLTKLKEIVKAVTSQGWSAATPIAVISRGTRIDQQVVVGSLANIEDKVRQTEILPPALIIVGKTIDFYKPFSGPGRLLYLGTYPEKYKPLGIIHFPMIEISAAKIEKPKAVLAAVDQTDTILLTSRCGVKYFLEFLAKTKYDLEKLRLKDFVLIGAETQRQLLMYGFSPRLVADEETSEGLLAKMKKHLKLKGQKILFPRSALPNPLLQQQLAKAGAKVDVVLVYENHKPAKRAWPAGKIKGAIFTSPSTVKNFLEDYERIPSEWVVYAKGTRTQKALKESGYTSIVLQS